MRHRTSSVGSPVEEVDVYEVIFTTRDREPVLLLTDGETTLAQFSGPDAYEKVALYMDECL